MAQETIVIKDYYKDLNIVDLTDKTRTEVFDYLKSNPQVDCALRTIHRSFKVNNIASFEIDKSSKRRFFQLPLAHDCDSLYNIVSNVDIQFMIGSSSCKTYPAAFITKDNPLMMIVLQNQMVYINFYLEDDFNGEFTLEYIETHHQHHHRAKLATAEIVG